MKIELVKEVKRDGTFYSIEVDGRYVDKSSSLNETDAKAQFDFIVENNGLLFARQILESIVI